MALNGAQSWIYQLQGVDPVQVAKSDADLAVIDFAIDGTPNPLPRADVEQMQIKPDGSRRLVLAYLSIGEAESYRSYWQPGWSADPPEWVGPENPEWAGNYPVQFWNSAWQAIIYDAPDSYLEQIQAAGFDGVYLDRVDVFEDKDLGLTGDERMQRMVAFVADLAEHARDKIPGFIVVAQNGEELLQEPTYAQTIDGLGKEDLFFGLAGDGQANPKTEIRESLRLILPFIKAGKPVFLVEYVQTPQDEEIARRDALALGVPLFIGNRDLDRVTSR